MALNERMKGLFNHGKEFVAKAGGKAQDLGERGFLMVDIKRLEGQAQKHFLRLAEEVYSAFTERGQPSVERDTPEIKAILDEIASVQEEITKKDAEIQTLKGGKTE